MKHLTIALFCVLFAGHFCPVSAKDAIQKNNFGKEIFTSNGEKKNFTQAEIGFLKTSNTISKTVSENKPSLNSFNTASSTEAATTKNLMNPKVDLLYTLMGSSIGRNSMHSVDIDSDGKLEIICTASSSTFGSGNYWYVLKKDSITSTWSPSWASKSGSGSINTLEVADYDSDGKLEILIGYDDGSLEIFNAKTLVLLNTLKIPNESINSIVIADADNDGTNEIVLGCDNSTFLVNASSLTTEYKIAKGSSVVRVGKLEDNGKNEIAMSAGFVYLLKDSVLTQVWNFNTSGGSYMELSDVDGDAKQEIILAQSWYNIYAYDVDTQTTKYTINSNLDINSLLLTDVNGDGKDEILYGDGQWGSVHCLNAVTKAQLWSVSNPEHGVAALNFADVNNDGQKELLWSAGWTSTGSDYLYIYNIKDSKLIWRSDDINGPFYALATGDVDEDGKDEIVATSYQSESGYDSGVLFIFDAQTNRLKWKSNGTFFTDTWEGVYTAAVSDVDNDGKNEIVVATDQLYDGKIWVVDGKTHTIKSSNLFSVGEFHSLAIDDVDNDGQKEIITTDNSKLYIINPMTWAIKGSVSCNYSYSISPLVRCSDVNGDGFKEVILCSSVLSIINGRDFSSWSTTSSNYTCLDVFDWNNDGISDILVGNSNGRVQVYDGRSQSVMADFQPESSTITAVRGFRTGRNVYFIYSCNGAINIYQNASNCSASNSFGSYVGAAESLKLYNQQANSTELLIGSASSIWRMYLNFISVSADSLTLEATGNSTASLNIKTNDKWSINGCQNWLSMTNATGTGELTIKLTAEPNYSVNKRSASLVVTGEKSIPYAITVIQNGVPPVLSLDLDTVKLGASESLSKRIAVSGNVSWVVSIDKNWLTVSKLSGTGQDTLKLTAQANLTLVAREALVTFTGTNSITRTVKVIQEAGSPMLMIYTSKLPVSYASGSSAVLNITSNVTWTVSSNQSWTYLSKTNGSGSTYVRIYAEENPYIHERTGIITITGAGLSPQTVEVIQEQAPPVLMADKNLAKISKVNEEVSFEVISNVQWRIINNQNWLRISRDTGSTQAKIIVTAEPNVSGEIRAATLLLLADGMEPFIVNVLQEETADMADKDLTSLQICSNDFSSELTIRNLMYNASISIYDIKGKLIITKNITTTSETIDISSYPKGIYAIKYRDGKTVKISKFIKR